jgi:hypothetical protein
MTWHSCHTTTPRCRTRILTWNNISRDRAQDQQEKEVMKINTSANTPTTIGGESIIVLESFVDLINKQGGTDRDATARIGKTRRMLLC